MAAVHPGQRPMVGASLAPHPLRAPSRVRPAHPRILAANGSRNRRAAQIAEDLAQRRQHSRLIRARSLDGCILGRGDSHSALESLEMEPVEDLHRRQVRFDCQEPRSELPEFVQWTRASSPSRASCDDGSLPVRRFPNDLLDHALGRAGLPGTLGHAQPVLLEDLNFVTPHGPSLAEGGGRIPGKRGVRISGTDSSLIVSISRAERDRGFGTFRSSISEGRSGFASRRIGSRGLPTRESVLSSRPDSKNFGECSRNLLLEVQ